MNIKKTINGPLPNLELTIEQITAIIHNVLKTMNDKFDFNNLKNNIKRYVMDNKLGVFQESNTIYEGELSQSDISIIREILWDCIISRYLTPGANGHDEFPNLTITERGRKYFNSLNSI